MRDSGMHSSRIAPCRMNGFENSICLSVTIDSDTNVAPTSEGSGTFLSIFMSTLATPG